MQFLLGLSLFHLRNEIHKLISQIGFTYFLVVSTLLKCLFSQFVIKLQALWWLKVMTDQLFDIELKLLEIVSRRALLTHIQLQHFPQSTVDEVFTCLQLAHGDRPLLPFSLAHHVHDGAFPFPLHSAFSHLSQHLMHTRENAVLISQVLSLVAGRHLQRVFLQEVTAFLHGLAVIASDVLDQAIEYDLKSVVLGDVLMFVVPTVFSQKGEALNILLKLLLLGKRKALQYPEELLSNQFGPVEAFLMVIFLEILGSFSEDGHVFRCKQPGLKLSHVSYLAVLAILLKQPVDVVLGIGYFELFLQSFKDPLLHQPMMGGQVGGVEEVLGLQIIELLHAPPAEEEVVLLLGLHILIFVVDLAEGVAPADVLVVLVDARVDLVLERPLLMQGDILQVDVRVDGIALVHHLDLLVALAECQELLWVGEEALGGGGREEDGIGLFAVG